MESKDWSGFGYLSADSPGMPGRRIESFEVLPAIQRNPRVQVNFVSFRSFLTTIWKRHNSYWYVLNIRTLRSSHGNQVDNQT